MNTRSQEINAQQFAEDLQQLLQMGFEQNRASEALRRGKNVGGALVLLMDSDPQNQS